MPRITEKLKFVTVCAVKVYAKAGIGRKVGHKKTMFSNQFSIKLPRKRKSLIVQGNFGKIVTSKGPNCVF